MKRWLAFAPLIAFAGLPLALAMRLTPAQPPARVDPMISKPLPVVELAQLPGFTPFELAEIQGPALVNIWASWCAPCRVENPVLMALSAEGVPIYGLAYQDEDEASQRFLASLGDPFTAIAADKTGRVGVLLGITGVPETFVINAEGMITARWAGPLTPAIADRVIRPALAAR